MTEIRVVIAYARMDFVVRALIDAVRESVDLRLVATVDSLASDPKYAIDEPEKIEAIVVVGTRDEIDAWSRELPEWTRDLVFIRVTLGSDVVHFARRGVGHSVLLETLRTLARTPRAELRTADYVAVDSHATADGSLDVTLVETSPWTAGRGLELAIQWVDAALLRAVARWPTSGGRLNLDTDAARQLLMDAPYDATDGQGPSEAEVAGRVAELEAHVYSSPEDDERLTGLARRLGLRSIELQAFLLCLAPDLDLRYGRIFGYLHDDGSRRYATLDLIATLLGDPPAVRASLFCTGVLFDSRLLAHDPTRLPYADEPLRVDPTVVAWLLSGVRALAADRGLAACLRHDPWPGAALLTRPDDHAQSEALGRLLSPYSDVHRWLLLAGDSDGWRGVAELAVRQLGLKIARIDGGVLSNLAQSERIEVVSRLARDCVLDGVAAVVDGTGFPTIPVALETLEALAGALARTRRPCALIAPTPDRLVAVLPPQGLQQLDRRPLDAAMRARYFQRATEGSSLDLVLTDGQAAALAAVFALPLPQIERAAHLAAAGSTRDDSVADREQHLRDACRRVAAPELPKVATRVPAMFSLDQVVLPDAQKSQLQEVVANVRLAPQVLDQWGLGTHLPYGRGVTALFFGASGCGKTVAAQGIARELGADLYVIDLSRVMSKWIGETEKSLDTAFTEAENAGAVLLFDEADALFSRRVSGAGDAYARHSNIEIAFLLQRMESFTGLAILTTNLRQNMDEAFLRRLRFVIEFPKPDAVAREKIWRQCFEGVAQLSQSVSLVDLARRVQVTGGSIRQIALRAAFAAAAEHEDILTRHIHEAVRAELLKLGMSAAAGEFVTKAA